MILHLKSPNVICINQQSDLLMYSSGQKKGGYSSGTLYHTSKWKGRPPPPPVTSTELNIPKSGCFSRRFILCSKMEPLLQNGAFFFYSFGRIDALLKGFLVLLRSILSEPSDGIFGVFGQLRFNLVCSATDVS